jgi:Immunity protein Imm5
MHDLDFAVAAALNAVKSDYEHELNWTLRRAIYYALGAEGRFTQGWLAILAAERVLPIFEAAAPNEDLPRRLIDLARDVLVGTLGAEEAWETANEAHYEIGSMGDSLPLNAYFAAVAASRAVIEACGHDPFDGLGGFMRFLDVDDDEGGGVPAEDWSDIELAEVGGDTASSAAVAASCGIESPVCDPGKLLDFWTWWLTDAIRRAVQADR